MNKKILIFVIIGLLLIKTSSEFIMVGDASITNNKIIENKEPGKAVKIVTNEISLPDLKIEGKATRDWLAYEYILTFVIYNYGNAKVDAGEYIAIKNEFWFQGKVWYYTAVFCLDKSLYPGDHWTCQDRLTTEAVLGYVEIDPTDYGDAKPIFHDCEPKTLNPDPVHGLIPESNEDNNEGSIKLSRLKSCAFLFFERLFNLPIFLKLLKL